MPELPDITVYIDALERRIAGEPLERLRLTHPFLLRTATPPVKCCEGKHVITLKRLGKRIAIGLEDELWLVLHLMIAGRLHWKPPGSDPPGRRGLAAFDFPNGSLILTEAGTKRRASLHVVQGAADLAAHDPGGLEVLDCAPEAFAARLVGENHTLKRALTDPKLFSGIGNAYSDEILHRARLSPVAMTGKLNGDEIARLYEATRSTLEDWTARLRAETGGGFPEKVTAFRERHGGARPLRQALPGLRHGGPAHPPRRQRDQLLPALPDRRPGARRPLALPPAQAGLAALDRGAGKAPGHAPGLNSCFPIFSGRIRPLRKRSFSTHLPVGTVLSPVR